MRHLFLAIHHPKPDHADDLVAAMGKFGSQLGTIAGMLGASAWRDGERIVAISIWESRERFIAAGPALTGAVADVPFAEWESRPRELFTLDEVVTGDRD
jgi:Antibiotic biosynthesis monooxygenase